MNSKPMFFRRGFIVDQRAVLGLPMRLTVSLIIGVVALVVIFGFVFGVCLFPQKLVVDVEPVVHFVSGGSCGNFSINVTVTDSSGNPVKDASVIIKGLSGAGSNYTDSQGFASVNIEGCLKPGRSEGYFDVRVDASGCFERFSQVDMIKVVRS